MQILRTRRELQKFALETRLSGKTIGLVPTMGFLHEGHLSLIDIARSKADVVIVSVFVNPKQFGPNEDFDKYPRDFERDAALCEEHGTDVIFAPEIDSMYNSDSSVWVEETMLSRPLCGASRPGFFRGVTTVVAKLFNLALPNFAVFGLKDAQQLFVIRRMVRDLDFPLEIIAAPLVRGEDGLALSSRNRYLTEDEHKRALSIHQSLLQAKAAIMESHDNLALAINNAKAMVTASGGRVDYITALDSETMESPTENTKEILLAAAVFFGTTRLIDNELFVW
jgi:pantoate--beta-alanine ligase